MGSKGSGLFMVYTVNSTSLHIPQPQTRNPIGRFRALDFSTVSRVSLQSGHPKPPRALAEKVAVSGDMI